MRIDLSDGSRPEKTMRKIAFLLFPLVTLFAVSACNTIQGVGEDLESVGKTVAREAKD